MGVIPDAWELRQQELGPKPTVMGDVYRKVADSVPVPDSLTHQNLVLWMAGVWRRLPWDVRANLTRSM